MAKSEKVIKSQGEILPATPSDVQVIEHGRDIHMYRLTDAELDTFTGNYYSLNIFFFSLCIGALIGFAITLLAVDLPDRTFAIFIALICVSGLLGIYFGIKACIERIALKRGIKQIRDSRKVST